MRHFDRSVALAALLAVLVSSAARAQDAGAAMAPGEPSVIAVTAPDVTAAAPVETTEPAPAPLTTRPTGRGLPVRVHVGMFFVDVAKVDENENTFDATVDLRLTWEDPRLGSDAPTAHTERWRDAEADARLEEIWYPDVRLTNLDDEPAHVARGLSIDPDGRVELLVRTQGTFRVSLDVTRFPFDRQSLDVEVLSEHDPVEYVLFTFPQEDLDFSRVASGVDIEGWKPGVVSLRRELQHGWHGDNHDKVTVSLEVARESGHTAPPIFIPLLASLLIPLLALWLQSFEDGGFKIEAFELANVIVGGLFAVIALNFTVNSEFSTLAYGDNTVARLFALNYLTLAISLFINLVLFKFNLIGRWFGPLVAEETFKFLTWAVPTLAFCTALAFVAVAYA